MDRRAIDADPNITQPNKPTQQQVQQDELDMIDHVLLSLTLAQRVAAVYDAPTRITAELAALTPGIYLWVEQGIATNADDLAQAAGELDVLFATLRIRDNVGGVVVDEAVEIVLRALAAIVEDIDSTLAAAAKRPSRADVVGDVIPLPTEYLRP